MVDKLADGTFAPGHSLSRGGSSPVLKVEEYYRFFTSWFDTEKWRAVLESALEDAVHGESASARHYGRQDLFKLAVPLLVLVQHYHSGEIKLDASELSDALANMVDMLSIEGKAELLDE